MVDGCHSAVGFKKTRKAGVDAFIAAALIAFSRLYLFLHFPTDVLAGIARGIALGVLANLFTGHIWKVYVAQKKNGGFAL